MYLTGPSQKAASATQSRHKSLEQGSHRLSIVLQYCAVPHDEKICHFLFWRVHWLYWQIYTSRIDRQQYEALFHRDLLKDFRLPLFLMNLLGWIGTDGSAFPLTERGSRWAHRFQMLFSLTFIDEVLTHCQRDPWPEEIVLR